MSPRNLDARTLERMMVSVGRLFPADADSSLLHVGAIDMKPILWSMLACLIASGCLHSPSAVNELNRVIVDDQRRDIKVLIGTTTISDSEDGKREIVLEARNNTALTMWVPNSDGSRGLIECEAVNIMELGDDLSGIHYDHAICEFPDQYMQLKPGEACTYVYELPDGFSTSLSISVWAPWRTSAGELVSPETKRATLPEGSILIEDVRGKTKNR